jgi:hypothetical protein
MGTLKVYLDDSGEETSADEVSVAVGGAVGSSETWTHDVQAGWLKVLADYGLSLGQFHMTDVMAFGGDFKLWKERGAGHRDEFANRLLDVICGSGVQPIGVTLPLHHYRKLEPAAQDALYGKAYFTALHFLYQVLATYLGVRATVNPVADGEGADILLAEKRKHIGKAEAAFKTVREVHQHGHLLKSLVPYGKPPITVELQAADLIAWSLTRFYREPFGFVGRRLLEDGAGIFHTLTEQDLTDSFDAGV